MDTQHLIDLGLLDPAELQSLIDAIDNNANSRLGTFVPPGFAPYFKEPFFYNVDYPLGAAALGATTARSTPINNDSYFCWFAGACTIFDNTGLAGNVQPNVSPMRVNIKDTSSGKYMSDIATPIGNVFGTGLQPVTFLYRAKIFNPGGQITVELTNPGAAALSVCLTFIGFKIYKMLDAEVQIPR